MIPLSVRMTGWMRYRDEQVADFGGGRLIAIIGENGAGKSSIFDAITFALYGKHRLGKMHAGELISQDVDRLSVEFEFEAADQRYLVRRSRGHKESERDQSLFVWDAERGDWAQVPGTEKEDALKRSLDHIVRLSAEAFTSSFMLQQGSATEFLDADPKPRFEIISGLIGLKEYEAIEKRARDAGRAEKLRLDDLTSRLKEFDDIDESAVERARDAVASQSKREAAAAAAHAAAQAVLADARRHARLVAEVAELDGQIAGAATVIAEKDAIEKDASLFETLSAASETMSRVQAALADAKRAAAVADRALREASAIDVDALAAAHRKAGAALEKAGAAATSSEKEHAAAVKAERDAHDFAGIATSFLDGRAHVAQCDATLAEHAEQLAGLAATQKQHDSDLRAQGTQVEAAEKALDAAREAAATAKARADSLKSQLAERKAAAREATCAHCGQPIDKKVAKAQIEELTAELADAQTQASGAQAVEKTAATERAASKKSHDELAATAAKEAQRLHRIEGERTTVAADRDRVATVVAELEARIKPRLKEIASAQTAHNAASARLSETEAALARAREQYEQARAADERTRRASDEGLRARAEAESSAREQAAVAEGHRKQAEAFTSGLGALAGEALADPDAVASVLEEQRRILASAPARKAALERAIKDETAWAAQRDVKRQDITAIPEAHRIDERDAIAAATASDEAARAAKGELQSAQQRLSTIEARIEQITMMQAERKRAEARQKLLRKLVKLLGKGGLQGALVTTALTTITTYANAFLQRLTGGSLQLVIHRGEGDALELQAIDSTCMREPRSAKVLSGSQKFRCAVAIASGIGQYAGAGGMRSIVIDEGFGSLDQAGQALMVDELKQLAMHMDKVIVVSHLDAFTDPGNFPDRILVETSGAGSRIRKLF